MHPEVLDGVNVVITSFNRIDATARCIKSVRRHTKIPYVLTVVDDASTDGSLEYLLMLYKKKEIDRLFVHKTNMGVAVSVNTGIGDQLYAYTVKLDNDMIIKDDGWLPHLVETAEKNPDAGVVAYDVYFDKAFGESDYCGGSAMLMTAEVLRRIGYFCEEYGLYGEEDSDFGLRVRLSGLKNYYTPPEGRVEHDHEQRSYGSAENDERRTRKARADAICRHFLNLFLYRNELRPIRLARRFVAVSQPGAPIEYAEDESYREFLDDIRSLQKQFVAQHKETLEAFIGTSLDE